MPENQEQIESRLCGYVDDTLDPAERAEIEAHLNAHPQHRQLLGELRKMREALRALPREKAPAELSESFTGQLERSVLLDGIGDQPIEPRMRIVRWPQLAAVAAIVLLAGGLGMVVYFELSQPKPLPQFSQNTHMSAPLTDSDALAESVHGKKLAEAPPAPSAPPLPAAESPDASHVAQNVPAPLAVAAPPGELGRQAAVADRQTLEQSASPASAQAAAIAHSALASRQVQALLGPTEQLKSGGRPVVVMVVSTADLNAATRKLGSYLETNNADWQAAATVDGLLQQQQKAFYGGARDFGGVGKAKDITAAAAPAPSGGDNGTGQPTTEPQTQPGAPAYAGRPAADAQPMNNAGLDAQSQRQGTSNSISGNPISNARVGEPDQAGAVPNRLYVVHNLSYQQATQLSDMLRQTGPNAQAPMFANQSNDGSYRFEFDRGANQQQPPLAPANDIAQATTQPATEPFEATPHGNDVLTAHADIRTPETRPASAAAPAGPSPAAIGGIVPLNKQTLLGSSPVDLVIVMNTPAPASAPAPAEPTTSPATAPSTAPATQPEE